MTTPWLEQLHTAPATERGALLERLVTSEFRASLLMTEGEELPLDQSYFDLGLTSLGAVGIEQKLEAMLGGAIDSGAVFDDPTIGELLAQLRAGLLAPYFAP